VQLTCLDLTLIASKTIYIWVDEQPEKEALDMASSVGCAAYLVVIPLCAVIGVVAVLA